MPAPLAKGLIIAASVLVAAGIAIYESPQVRQWVDQSRRKIAVALHSLGDEIQPRNSSDGDAEYLRKRREEIIRRNRNELIRRAREEGVAVDLDELANIGKEDLEMAERRGRSKTNASSRSFDELVGSDGKLKESGDSTAKTATGMPSSDNALRNRKLGAARLATGATAANPFIDEANVLFDREEDEAPSPKPFPYIESRETSATVQDEPMPPPTTGQLIDLSPDSIHIQPENVQTASISSLNSTPLDQRSQAGEDQATQSFYSFTSENPWARSQNLTVENPDIIATHDGDDSDPENISTGTLTPRSEHSAFTGVSTGASVVGSQADDVAVLSMQNDDDHDARSEVFSEGGFSEVEGERRLGVMTPSSWTDIGSDVGSESEL